MSIAKSIHNVHQSKKLIRVLNWLGISVNYDDLERTGFTLINHLLKGLGLGENHVPISNSIDKSSLYGSLDNFLTVLKTQNQEHGVVMMQCLRCSKIKKRTDILFYLLRIKMIVKINDLLIQSLNAKKSFIFKNVVKLK